MHTTSRLFRTVLVAAGLMAVSATAAQAMALGPANVPGHDPLGFTAAHHQLPAVPAPSGGTIVLHRSGTQVGHQPTIASGQPMAAAVDSPTDQTAPLVITQPVSTQTADDGFGWMAAGVGAFVAALALIVFAAIAAAIVRPRQTVQL